MTIDKKICNIKQSLKLVTKFFICYSVSNTKDKNNNEEVKVAVHALDISLKLTNSSVSIQSSSSKVFLDFGYPSIIASRISEDILLRFL